MRNLRNNAKSSYASHASRGAGLLSLALAAGLLGSSGAAAQTTAAAKMDEPLARQVSETPKAGWVSVVVHLSGELTPDRRAAITRLQGDIYRHLPLIESVAVRVPSRNLSRLAALAFVARLSSDQSVRKTDEFTVGASGADTAVGQYNLTGLGVTVAVLDSGIQTEHPDFVSISTWKTRNLASVNFAGDNRTDDPCGHGTHVAGIIAGNGRSSSGGAYWRTFYGIARRANLVNVRVLDGQGQGSVSNVVAGVQWVINNRSAYNIRVLNLSLGHEVGESYTTDPLCLAVEKAWKAGIVVVCSAGNGGRKNGAAASGRDNEGYGTSYGSIQSPGNSPYVITVGAMKTAGARNGDQIATYSSRGPSRLDFVLKPDLVAPGNRIISANASGSYLETNYAASNVVKLSEYANSSNSKDSNKYFRLSGTSMAAPVVSGAAALLLQSDPSLSPDTIKARLMVSADKWGFGDGRTDPCTFGAGYLNIPAALAATAVATRYAISPTLATDSRGAVYVNSQQILWGDGGVWGAGIPSLNTVWGNQIIWGDNLLTNSPVLVGEGVWSDQIIWGETYDRVDLSATAIRGE